ncbi:MAG: NAD(P)/FAD-dependent oxidoreductase [Bacteroidales bacterium]|nr:NAD(P)/FAD-dependent oxidoreductase [Bacteroidales bacterium]
MKHHEVAVIGAGPAGIACTIQLSRYGIMPLLFERDIPGGLLKNANLVENYPGFPGGIKGTKLIEKMTRQLDMVNVPVIHENVIIVNYKEDLFRIKTDQNTYISQKLVIASGTVPAEWTEFAIPETIRYKIFYEVYPLRELRDSVIVIIGAGDAAFDYAIQLAVNNKVMIMNRTEDLKCLPLLWQRAKANPRISYYENHVLRQVTEVPSSSQLKLLFQTKNEMASFLADYVIFATGRRPELSFCDPELLNHLDELQQDGKLYLAGDVKNDLFRQASIAAGDGIRAAMEIYFNESNKKNKE